MAIILASLTLKRDATVARKKTRNLASLMGFQSGLTLLTHLWIKPLMEECSRSAVKTTSQWQIQRSQAG